MLKPEEIARLIEDDRSSTRKRRACTGQRYYEADHDIKAYKVMYVDGSGNVVEDTTRSNIRIPHAFFTELVDQKVQYLLSSDERIARTDIPELQNRLDGYFGDEFTAELEGLLTGAAKHGASYLYAYKSDEGTRFVHAEMLRITEVAAGQSPDKKAHVLYWWIEKRSKDERVAHVQDWDDAYVAYYVSSAKDGTVTGLVQDPDEKINPRPHIIEQEGVGESAKLIGDAYGRIPFFRLDNNDKQQSDLKPIKGLIDDYDLMACGLSNNLQDVAEGIYVVRGWEGDNLSDLITNIRAKKAINIPTDGDMDIRTIDVPYEARKQKLELDEKNIYRFGMGFNASQVGDGNITNVVIKSRYALLDLKCNKAETRLRSMMRQVIRLVIDEINAEDGTSYKPADVYLRFDRQVITNETDDANRKKAEAERQQIEINTLLMAAARLDDETVAKNICEILDIEYEAIKNKLPENPYSLTEAIKQLEGQEPPPEDGGGEA